MNDMKAKRCDWKRINDTNIFLVSSASTWARIRLAWLTIIDPDKFHVACIPPIEWVNSKLKVIKTNEAKG
jgi:hypothetical protein